MMLGRRAMLSGAAAMLAWPMDAAATTAALLDRAAALPAAEGLALLNGATAATARERLDLSAARAGLAIDAELMRMGAPGRSALKPWIAARAGTRGLASDPEGAVLYSLLAQRGSGRIDLGAAERRLWRELVRLHRQARRVFDDLGRWRGTLAASYDALWRDERYLYTDDRTGRDAAVLDMNADLARLRAVTPRLVGPLPPAALAASIRALSPAEIAAGRGGYRDQPAGGGPGGYVVDLKDVRRRPRWTLPSVVAHETLPGHLALGSTEAAAPPHPLRLDYAAAFVEGWAIHAETIAPGFDRLEQLGRIHWLLFRTCRALADIGIHRHGWSHDETHAWLRQWQGEAAYFAPYDIEIPRIAREPGTRLGEAATWLAIADRVRGLGDAAKRETYHDLLAGGRRRIEDIAG